ncbi:TPA: acyltransferase [Enterobacter cloacae]|nr:acyltransferase [Enterobacter cloacae]
MQSQRLDSLTSLRAFAALGVFFSHMGFIQYSSNPIISSSFKYFNLGYAGVTFFFILSGFILTYSFTRSLESGGAKFSDFIMHRIFRIYPVHLLCLATFVVVSLHYDPGYAVDLQKLIKNALLLQSFSVAKADYFSFNAVSWSISVEMFFYVCFCFLFFAQKRTIVLFTIVVISVSMYLNKNNALQNDISHWFYYINPFIRLPDFMIGMLMCKLYFGFKKSPSKEFLSIAEITSVMFVCLSFYIAANGGDLGGLKWDVIFIPSMASAVFIFAFNGGILSKILSNKFLVFCGDASFAFYLIHAIVINVLHKNIYINNPGVKDALAFILISFVVSFALASLIYVLFEKPINKNLRDRWKSMKIIAVADSGAKRVV